MPNETLERRRAQKRMQTIAKRTPKETGSSRRRKVEPYDSIKYITGIQSEHVCVIRKDGTCPPKPKRNTTLIMKTNQFND